MSHTKGPWRVGFKDGSGADQIVTEYDGELPSKSIAVVSWGCGCCKGEATAEDLANARLIASAPALLEALKDVMQEFEDRYDGAPDAKMQWMGHLMHQIEQAIAQAEGRS